MNTPPKTGRPSVFRRQVYIKKKFQNNFIFKFTMVLVLGGILSVSLTLFNTQGTLTTSYINSKLVVQSTPLAIMPSVIFTTLITTIILGIVAGFVTLLVSHKIAGPMYRFENDIQRIATGNLKDRIRIRHGDQFQEMANSLNQMIDSLNISVTEIGKEVEQLVNSETLPDECKTSLVGLQKTICQRFTV